jgi:hypothetical protein
MNAGYEETASKPNLFYGRDDGAIAGGPYVVFFADLRGTGIIPIWEDSDPLFYASMKPSPPGWMQRRRCFQEIGRLMSGFGLRLRLSFCSTSEPGGLFFDDVGDGFCARCGVDFRADGLYCTGCLPGILVERKAARSFACGACGEGIDAENDVYIRHHVTYFPESVVIVHDACHAAIHLGGKHPNLAPPSGDAERFYGWRRERPLDPTRAP